MSESIKPKVTLGSVTRAIAVLGVLEAAPGSRLMEISKELDANPTTVLRAIRVLEEHGFVNRGADNGYTLGARLMELGQAAALAINVVEELRGSLTKFSRLYNVTAHVGMLRDGMITVVEKIDPPAPLVRYSTLGTRMPLHATAGGKATLALLASLAVPVDLTTLELDRYTPSTITSVERLKAELPKVRELGFSMEFGEYQVGFSCVGTALRVDDEIYTLSLSGQQVEENVLAQRGVAMMKAVDRFLRRHKNVAQSIRPFNEEDDPKRQTLL